ncbi:MAG: hypothetical protein P8184_20650, partial [Calditrichia bacterium]
LRNNIRILRIYLRGNLEWWIRSLHELEIKQIRPPVYRFITVLLHDSGSSFAPGRRATGGVRCNPSQW